MCVDENQVVNEKRQKKQRDIGNWKTVRKINLKIIKNRIETYYKYQFLEHSFLVAKPISVLLRSRTLKFIPKSTENNKLYYTFYAKYNSKNVMNFNTDRYTSYIIFNKISDGFRTVSKSRFEFFNC